MIRLVIFDFDGTLTYNDSLDFICSLNDKYECSKLLNERFFLGKDSKTNSLAQRIRLLEGLSLNDIWDKLKQSDLLRTGVVDLFDILYKENIDTVLCSGNIMPLLDYYASQLRISNVFGNEIIVESNGRITGELMMPMTIDFKRKKCADYIHHKKYSFNEIAIVGDSISDIHMMTLGKYRFFIDPKNGVENMVSNAIVVSDIEELTKSFLTLFSNLHEEH